MVWWGRDGADQSTGPCWRGLRKERLLDFTPRGTMGGPGSSAHEKGQVVQKDGPVGGERAPGASRSLGGRKRREA